MSINSALLAGVSGLIANSSALAAISDNIATRRAARLSAAASASVRRYVACTCRSVANTGSFPEADADMSGLDQAFTEVSSRIAVWLSITPPYSGKMFWQKKSCSERVRADVQSDRICTL